ncbi:hypothetical protein EI555_003194 [Monodon monoceros]|uniref:Somatostatin/Cortistatin C-terminal domain-containing protein n=1 Tax=Monodon monoceros TaxID=40151 RepID=A0A4U1FM09_MONMO|nr:hypothetical protein EI555_003194 [Monodon monoceros]
MLLPLCCRCPQGPPLPFPWRAASPAATGASQARAVSFLGGEAREMSKRQEVLPLQQSTCRDETPCKNFYWKTFSSCK